VEDVVSRTVKLFLALIAVLLQSCANYLYTGEITASDADGKLRQSIIYWSKTKAWLGKPKAGQAIVLTECGVPIRYDQRPEHIVFRGTPGDDKIPGQPPPATDDLVCGQFVRNDRLVDIEAGEVKLTVLCEAVNDEFSALKRSYLKARPEPYTFVVTRSKSTSLLGKVPDAPVTPECKMSE